MTKIRIHRDDLVKILELVDQLNPASDREFGTGYIEICQDCSSGVGSVLSAHVPVEIKGHYGTFTKTIIDEDAW